MEWGFCGPATFEMKGTRVAKAAGSDGVAGFNRS